MNSARSKNPTVPEQEKGDNKEKARSIEQAPGTTYGC